MEHSTISKRKMMENDHTDWNCRVSECIPGWLCLFHCFQSWTLWGAVSPKFVTWENDDEQKPCRHVKCCRGFWKIMQCCYANYQFRKRTWISSQKVLVSKKLMMKTHVAIEITWGDTMTNRSNQLTMQQVFDEVQAVLGMVGHGPGKTSELLGIRVLTG